MKVIKNLVFLGFAYELIWQKGEDRRSKITLFKLQTSLSSGGKNIYGLFSNSQGTSIYVLPFKDVIIEPYKAGAAKARALSNRWTGYDADIALKLNIPDSSTTLKKIGTLEKIEYTSDKLERSRDTKGRFSLYTHKFKTPLHLYADREKNPRVFGAKLGAKKIVTSRGLVG